jgi:tRNA(Ile)-lysidine synthase
MAWSLTHAKLHTQLRNSLLLPKHSAILMAVSGGQDSLCLAQLLIDLQPHWQWRLGLVHCDHRWRKDSADNAAHVLQLAQNWQIPAWVEVAAVAPTSEAAARDWRYTTFANLARQENYSYITTGHTSSDRAETLLYNLMRGSGTDGVGALDWVRSLDDQQPPLQLVRPLLSFSRQDTYALCQAQQLPIWEDSSNEDLSFRRNRIRKELLPYLQKHFNPQIEQALYHFADLSAAESDYLQAQASELYERVVTQSTSAWEIDIAALSAAPLALQRRVVRQVLQEGLARSPNFQQVEDLISLLKAPHGSKTSTYPGGFVGQVQKPILWFGIP